MKLVIFVISCIWICIIWGLVNIPINNRIGIYCWNGFEAFTLIMLIICAILSLKKKSKKKVNYISKITW